MWWNDWKFQLHWNKLEWVDPKSTPTVKSLGATFNFIDIWIKLLRETYRARSESYSISMEEMF